MKMLLRLFGAFCVATILAQCIVLGLSAYRGNLDGDTILQGFALLNGIDITGKRLEDAIRNGREAPMPTYDDVTKERAQKSLNLDMRERSIKLAKEQVDAKQRDLQLEITESLLFEDFDQARSLLEKLTAKGISIALDDFGTGYSSLGSLHNLPVDCVKIDRSFVHTLGNAKSTIVAAIINVAHTLGMKVVAEGVETEAQRAILESLGCEELQGHLVAPPMSNEDFLVWLEAHRKPHPVSVQEQKKD